jgi:hypothetical protein
MPDTPPQDQFDYPKMVEAAMRGVAREALRRVARDGLRGEHHFYVTFRTDLPGVALPDYLRTKYPEQMTIVLQHRFWGLDVGEEAFTVGLSFQSRQERLTIPFAAITTFADPSVNFGLQFQTPAPAATAAALPAPPTAETPPTPERQEAEIVTLDKFRKR